METFEIEELYDKLQSERPVTGDELVDSMWLPTVFREWSYVEHLYRTRRGIAVEKWERAGYLGRGSFGGVSRQEKVGSMPKEYRAVKEVERMSITDVSDDNDIAKAMRREIFHMAKLSKRSRHFPDFYGWYADDHMAYFAMEYAPHRDLATCMKQLGREGLPRSEDDAKEISRQLVFALVDMHKLGIVHRDLKPENIFVYERPPRPWRVKVGDLGLAKSSALSLPYTNWKMSCAAPEQLMMGEHASEDHYTEAVDLFALGFVVHFLLCGRFPLIEEQLRVYHLRKQTLPTQHLSDAGVSEDGIHFVAELIRLHPEERMTALKAREHAWLKRSTLTSFTGSGGAKSSETLNGSPNLDSIATGDFHEPETIDGKGHSQIQPPINHIQPVLFVNGALEPDNGTSSPASRPIEEHGTRVTQRWIASPGTDVSELDVELSGTIGDWDQFEANRQLLGYQESTYQEDLYTTPLDKNSKSYKARYAEAEKLEREIEEENKMKFQSQDRKGMSIEQKLAQFHKFEEKLKEDPPMYRLRKMRKKLAPKDRAELDSLREFSKYFKLPAHISNQDGVNHQASTSAKVDSILDSAQLPKLERSESKSSVSPGASRLEVPRNAPSTMRSISNTPSLTNNMFAALDHLNLDAGQERIPSTKIANSAVAQTQQKQEPHTTDQGPAQQLQPATIIRSGETLTKSQKKNRKRRGAMPR